MLFRSPAGGGTQTTLGANFFVSLDKELIHNRLYGALNFGWAPGATQARGATGWERASEMTMAGALATRITESLLVGGEVRYSRAFDGLTFNHSAGHAVFAGPNFFFRLAKNAWVAGSWNFQVAGKTFTTPGTLDLVNYERHQARVRLGIAF